MKTIRFSSTGQAVSDYKISKFVDEIFKSPKTRFNVSTHLVIDEIRARIKEKRINLDDITIMVEENEKILDVNGRSHDWYPEEETWDNILMKLM